ncbi:unnamed protein product [Rotaria sp. Silwood1]|nr:unnamed protein product [Rotaria sp. Silwood1]CAF3962318.1 unnamed protein product [Rotaria sp. Silwood1]CAF4844400.1 unnamed protein product [Rotaria sp. Silwood1]CAF4905263.1 unnamed protein product [Rotaria sp. Silwood1]
MPRNRQVAESFSMLNNSSIDQISFLCIYTIKNENRTALYIPLHSEFRDEDEVLILPYSSFQITKIIKDNYRRRIEVYLEECDTTSLDIQRSIL